MLQEDQLVGLITNERSSHGIVQIIPRNKYIQAMNRIAEIPINFIQIRGIQTHAGF